MKYKAFHFTAVVVLLAMLAACSSVGDTPPTQTAQVATAQVRATGMAKQLQGTDIATFRQATATAEVLQTRMDAVSKWPVLISDSFDANLNEWAEGEDKGDLADVVWSMAGGKFRWQATAHQGFVWWNYPTSSVLDDFYVAVDTQMENSAATAYMGVVFRMAADDQYNAFYVRNDGNFRLDQHTGDGWETLVDWTPSPAVKVDGVNRIQVLGEGNLFAFWINDTLVLTYSNDSFASGHVGLVVGLDADGDAGTFEFDDYELRAPTLPPTETPAP